MAFCKRFFILAAIFTLLCGCGYTKLAFSKIRTTFHPTPENLKISAPEKCLLVTGSVVGDAGKGVPLAVAAVAMWNSENRIVSYCILSNPGAYYLYLPEGRYQIMVFADLNRNSVFDRNELVGRRENPQPLSVEKERAVNGIIRNEDIPLHPERPQRSEAPFRLEISAAKPPEHSRYFPSAVITTLDDERFDEEYGNLGLYKPAVFFERINNFFYMLEEYDPEKIPVIFVHGAKGTPKDWDFVLQGLDRQRFQPWFFYYPSGLRLESVTDIFYDTFLSKKDVKTDRLVIAALSQGGLVVRAALNRCSAKDTDNLPQLFVSFCTPYGGVRSAAAVVAHSPVIVPSWIDMARGSNYIKKLHERKLPSGLDFHLFFAYGSDHLLKVGANDDGVISLRTQLVPKAQKEAVRMHGFNETHSEILRNGAVRDEFISILTGAR